MNVESASNDLLKVSSISEEVDKILDDNYLRAKLLIKNGANVNVKDEDGNTPLINACFDDNYLLSKLLIENGADVNAKNKNGMTALKFIPANSKIIKLLLYKGTDINNE